MKGCWWCRPLRHGGLPRDFLSLRSSTLSVIVIDSAPWQWHGLSLTSVFFVPRSFLYPVLSESQLCQRR